jgi:RNA polymerase sigma-70 factor (ECF subfamily)
VSQPAPAARLDAARAGDRAATEALLRELLPRIRRTVARYAGTGPEFDDIVQEVLMSVVRGLPAFRGDAALETWVHAICVRAACRRRATGDLLSFEERDTASAEDPSDWVGLGRLSAAVDELPPARRAVFVLHELDGEPVVELARSLEIPLNTAHSRLRLARKRFIERVRELGGPVDA